MYWWLFTLENWIGLSGILWGAGELFALLIAVPFIDRNPHRYWRQRPVAIGLGVLVMVFLIVLTILEAVTTRPSTWECDTSCIAPIAACGCSPRWQCSRPGWFPKP